MSSATSLNEVMADARSIVLAIFNRFGDGIIAATVCNEFITRWSGDGRQFCIVTSTQLSPYVRALCPNARVIALHKNDPIAWIKLKFLETFVYGGFDVGLNPYSFAMESRKVIQRAKWHRIYEHPDNDFMVNYYDRARAFLALDLHGDFVSPHFPSGSPERILITPESSEQRRCLTNNQLQRLLEQLEARWPKAKIVLAAKEKLECGNGRQFFLRQSRRSSELFLQELQKADLVVSVDSGPLHIAVAMNKRVIGLFSSTIPATVLNHSAQAYVLRSASLAATYCEVHKCSVPACMDKLDLADAPVPYIPVARRRIERDSCPYRSHD